MPGELDEIRRLSESSRADWRFKAARVRKAMEVDAEALSRALGAISWDEAVEGLKRNTLETIEKVMRCE